MFLSILIFILVYFTISNWVRYSAILVKILKNSIDTKEDKTVTKVNAQFNGLRLLAVLKEKTGLVFKVNVFHSDAIAGAMLGSPQKPLMVISDTAIKKLSNNELEWLMLHEAGHCVGYHVLKTLLIWLAIFLVGIFIISNLNLGLLNSLVIAVCFALVHLQLERYFSEYQADLYALKNVSDLRSMISANEKMKNATKKFIYKHSSITFLLTQHLTYDQRINLARARLNTNGSL